MHLRNLKRAGDARLDEVLALNRAVEVKTSADPQALCAAITEEGYQAAPQA